MSELEKISSVITTFHGGETDNGRIEFYEYSRSSYALARLIATVESFRRKGKVPGRITGASNVEVFTQLPEYGSWIYINNLWKTAKENVKLGIGFDALFAWTTGKSLDNMDLFNSNSDAVLDQVPEVDLSAADTVLTQRKRRTSRNIPALRDEPQRRRLTKAALAKSQETQKADKLSRISLETDIAVARQARRNLQAGGFAQLEDARRSLDGVAEIAASPGVRLFSEETTIINALDKFSAKEPSSAAAAAEQAARIQYAANDLGPRLTRRLIGDRFQADEIGADDEELDKLASRARPLVKEIVLPLRRTPTDMDLAVGRPGRKIAHIDEVRGRMISDSVLSREVYEIPVFVIEYNRVTHSGKCKIQSMDLDVPFSLNRQLIRRLSVKAIDSLKEEEKTFFARPYLDDDGAIRSLIVEDIQD
ncbi:hypothetical protein [Brevundimonas sp.]|uniref:hypothetical protein n=1 Tax=Brevundimonas sp. TaxID=1871086 RepID=UPI002E10F510|nr:hypothetical protein [Brevundimonas sp.]